MSFNKNKPLDEERYKSGRAALKADQLEDGATATIITISDVEEAEIDDPEAADGKRFNLVLSSEEFPDRGFWLNKTGLRILKDRFGNVPGEWVGERVALVKVRVNNPRTKQPTQSLQVAGPEEWDEVMELEDGPKRPKVSAKKAPTRAAKKARR